MIEALCRQFCNDYIFMLKNLIAGIVSLCAASASVAQTSSDSLRIDTLPTRFLEPVEITALRANEKTPFAKTNLSGAEISKLNVGQDLPFIMNFTPSMVVSSDAGNGVGYTYLKLRGSDASRINVTLNGIPYNDAESQGTFFVDLPDIASSSSSMQIQRGVGTSTNGAGAFAGSINLSTNGNVYKKNIELNNTFGSYNTFRNTLKFNSGLLKNNFLVDARLSRISSDGYVERASTKLYSGFLSVAHISPKNSFRYNLFSGKETTYQAWNGIEEQTLKTNRRFNSAGTERSGTPYENEVDDYLQTHNQFFFNHQFNNNWKSSVALFYTRGKGYYEQYKADQELPKYGLDWYITPVDTIKSTDLVRRLWLDNHFYGTVFSLQYDSEKTQFIFGGNANRYNGDHYGKIIWNKANVPISASYNYYLHDAHKTDLSAYAKLTREVFPFTNVYVDVQVRNVDYKINGFKNNPDIIIGKQYTFFNPKAGIAYNKNGLQLYASFARANKEPNRDDFEANVNDIPKPETLNDIEFGLKKANKAFTVGANAFYMFYDNQLVLTGKINDVGAYTRQNVKNSYRYGLELEGGINPNDNFQMAAKHYV